MGHGVGTIGGDDMTPRVGFQSYLAGTLDYRESDPLEAGHLDVLVTRLRAGDRTVSGEIIKGHYRLVAAIVADRVHSKRRYDDCLGAALLALTQAVDDAAPRENPEPPGGTEPGVLYDNNITYYITVSVRYAIRDEIASAHVVRMPGRTVRRRVAEGKLFAEVVPGDAVEIREDAERDHTEVGGGPVRPRAGASAGSYSLPFHIPASRPLCESPEFKEALARAVANPTEQAIVSLRAQGYTYAEVGQRVGLSTPRVGQIMALIEPRFDAYFRS
jgi:hypothetical protein